MRRFILKILRSRMLQPLWVRLHHMSLIGMNYFGGASIFSSGEKEVLEYIQRSLGKYKDLIVFDVGANSGDYSLLLNSMFKKQCRIYSFEPSKYTYDLLIKRTQNLDNILKFNFGFGSEDSQIPLFSKGKGRTTASVYFLKSENQTIKNQIEEIITLKTIDSFCEVEKINSIDLLKIDVEGHEFSVLIGAKKMINDSSIKFIQFEFGKCHIDAKVFFRDFYELLFPKFNIYRILPDGLYPIKSYNSSLEVFHTSNFLAERKQLNKC